MAEAARIEDRITSLAEMPDYKKVLIYGKSGSGKTTFLGTCPGPVLVLDPGEKGLLSLRHKDDVKRLEIRTWAEFEAAYWYVAQRSGGAFKTVAIDTVTKLQDMAIEKVAPDGGKLEFRQWGEVSSLLKAWFVLWRDLPMNVVFLAQDRTTEREDGSDFEVDPEVGPALMPSVARSLCAAVDVVVNSFVREQDVPYKAANGATKTRKEADYCLRVGPHSTYVTKYRTRPDVDVPRVLADPSFERLFKIGQ